MHRCVDRNINKKCILNPSSWILLYLNMLGYLSFTAPPGRDNFLTEVWQWVDQYGGRICDQLRRIGSSVDWSRKAFTMDENLSVRGGTRERGEGTAVIYFR